MKYTEVLNQMINAMEELDRFGDGLTMASCELTKKIVSSKLYNELLLSDINCNISELREDIITYFRGIKYETDEAIPFGWIIFYRKGTGIIMGSVSVYPNV